MKLLYITSTISSSGGVPKVLAAKSDYLISKYNYQIAIVYNEYVIKSVFYKFNSKVKLVNTKLDNSAVSFIIKFREALRNLIESYKPDVVVVCDNGFKGFLVPLLLKNTIPVVLEIHGSKYEIIQNDFSRWTLLRRKIQLVLKSYLIKKFDKVVFLNRNSAREWGFESPIVIPNAIRLIEKQQRDKDLQVVVAIGRHSYEKGLDRLLPIWKEVHTTFPEWVLKVYGQFSEETHFLKKEIIRLGLQNSVELLEPIHDIEKVYKSASLFVSTSRYEGFGLGILEAMASGLVVVSYDCPIGPSCFVENGQNGFLIENGNAESFKIKLLELIQNTELRNLIGDKAVEKAFDFSEDSIFPLWGFFFKSLC